MMMVEPISMALLSGAAGIGLALGRLTKSSKETAEEAETPQVVFQPGSNLQFFSIEDLIRPDELIHNAIKGNQVFINIKKIMNAPDKLYKFLHQLKIESQQNDLKLNQITKELLLLSRSGSPISVKRLRNIAKKKPDIDLDLFAG